MNGIYTLATLCLWLPLMGFCLFLSVGRLTGIRKGPIWRFALLAACGVMGGMVIFISDWDNIIPTFLIFLTAILICCSGSLMKRMTIGLMLASTVFSFNVLVDNWGTGIDVWTYTGRFLFGLGLYLVIRKFAPERDFELSPALWKLFFALTLPPVGIVFSLVLLTDYSSEKAVLQQFLLMLLALFSFAGLMGTMVVLAKQQKMKEDALLAAQNVQYYQTMEKQHFEVRRLKHDMANHLQAALGLPENQREKYLRELLKAPVFSQTLKYCGDNTVNIILSAKAAAMEQKNIEFHVLADIPEEIPMEKPDISAVLGNALDNAIEAVEKLPKEKRRISLEIRCARGILAFALRNPGKLEEGAGKQDFPGTTKPDKISHGLGLLSIRTVLKKYEGTMELRQEAEEVCLFIYCHMKNNHK